MKVVRRTPTLDAIRTVLRDVGGRYEFALDAFDGGISPLNRIKMQALVDADRNFMRVTPALLAIARERFRAAFVELISKGGAVRYTHLTNQIGLGIRTAIADRIANQGPDVHLEKLSDSWTKYKARNRLDPRIGWATGALRKSILRSPFRIRKAG